MKGRVGKTILTILTIFALTFSYFVILGNVISYALDSLEEQITKVNEQTYFDVYFKDGQNKVHTKLNNIKNGEKTSKFEFLSLFFILLNFYKSNILRCEL